MPERFWRYGFALYGEKATMPECSKRSHSTQPIDFTEIVAVIIVLAFSQSRHQERTKRPV